MIKWKMNWYIIKQSEFPVLLYMWYEIAQNCFCMNSTVFTWQQDAVLKKVWGHETQVPWLKAYDLSDVKAQKKNNRIIIRNYLVITE